MTEESTQPQTGTPTQSLKEVLIADRWRLLAVGLLVAGVAILFGFDIQVSRQVKLFAGVTAVAAAIAYAPAARIVAWLYRPSYTYLVELDASKADVAVWALPPPRWKELEVEEGELFPLQASVPAWECQEYDPETNSATGTWRGSASDLELIQERGRIAEIRGTLENLAKEGLGYRVMQSGIIRAAVRSVVMSFVEAFERDAVYDGDEIRRAIDQTLEEWEYEDDTMDSTDEPRDDDSLAEVNAGTNGTGRKPETRPEGED
jgi:hypothetical protein